MPVEYEVVSGIAVARCRGVVTGRDIKDLITRYVNDPALDRPHREVFDVREVGAYEISGDDVRAIVEYVKSTGDRFKNGKVAYVASRDMPYGIGRMFSFFSEDAGLELRAFRDMKEACAWLGIDAGLADGAGEKGP